MFRILNRLTLVALCAITLSAQTAKKPSIEGAWKVSEIVVAGADGASVKTRSQVC